MPVKAHECNGQAGTGPCTNKAKFRVNDVPVCGVHVHQLTMLAIETAGTAVVKPMPKRSIVTGLAIT